jgi:uncharacterized membrane protein
MQRLIKHVTGNLLAGIGAALPLGLTAYVIFKIEEFTKPLTEALFGRSAPFVGLGLILLAVYLFGLLITSLSGQYLLGRIDHLFSRLPGTRQLYAVWKQVLLAPPDHEGIFARVVLIPDEGGQRQIIAFTSGKPIPGDAGSICAFVPNTPNLLQGILYLVRLDRVQFSSIPVAEAVKMIITKGKYLPEGLGQVSGSPT